VTDGVSEKRGLYIDARLGHRILIMSCELIIDWQASSQGGYRCLKTPFLFHHSISRPYLVRSADRILSTVALML